MIARRIWNFRAIDYSTMQYAMFLVTREVRGKNPSELAKLLSSRLESDSEDFTTNERFHLHGGNGKQIHRMLARMTDYAETESGRQSNYAQYINRRGKNGFEVEHIWANHYGRHKEEFDHPADFAEYRNRFGGLLLLPKSFNASFGDKPYSHKREKYFGQNLLAQSLSEKAYSDDPGFKSFVQRSGLPFRAHEDFRKADVELRHELYRQIAEQVWNPSRLALALS
jgi:hypothetical protein